MPPQIDTDVNFSCCPTLRGVTDKACLLKSPRELTVCLQDSSYYHERGVWSEGSAEKDVHVVK